MAQLTVNEKLELWVLRNSTLTTYGVRGFVLDLCKLYDNEVGGTQVSKAEFSKMAGISPSSVSTYGKQVGESPEWQVRREPGLRPLYIPLFLEDAVTMG